MSSTKHYTERLPADDIERVPPDAGRLVGALRAIGYKFEQAIADFAAYYNYERYHETLDNVTPAGVYFDRPKEVLTQRATIKQQTLLERRRITLCAEVHMV